MVRIELHVELSYEIDEYGADFVFNIHAAHTPSQTVSAESLVLSQPVVQQVHTDAVTGNRYMRHHCTQALSTDRGAELVPGV